MQQVWSFKGAAYGCILGLLVGLLVAFVNFMKAPAEQPLINVSGGNSDSPQLAGLGGIGSGSLMPDPQGTNRFGYSSRAIQLANLAFDLNGEKGEENALRILSELELDPRDRLFAVKEYLGRNAAPSEKLVAALDGVKQQLDNGWQIELERRPETPSSEKGTSSRLDDLAWEVQLAQDRLKLRMDLIRAYKQIEHRETARSLIADAESDLRVCNEAVLAYNAAIAASHRQPPQPVKERAVLWPAFLSAFGFILTGIANPVLQALGGGVVARTKSRRKTKP